MPPKKHGMACSQSDVNERLLAAARRGDAEAAAWAIDDGADVEHQDPSTGSALMSACFNGDAGLARILIQRGANPDAVSPNGSTASLMALLGGHAACALLMSEAGADVLGKSFHGIGPLSLACHEGDRHECVALLLSLGADPNERQLGSGMTPALICSRDGRAQSLRLLLAAGADPATTTSIPPADPLDIPSEPSWPCLHHAAFGGHWECVRALLEHGADPEWVDEDGLTAQAICLSEGHSGCSGIIQARLASLAEQRELGAAVGPAPADSRPARI